MNRRQVLWTTGLATVGLTGIAPVSADSHGTRFIHKGQQLRLAATGKSLVEGQTQLAAGVPLWVRLRSDGESPFIKTAETTVREDGRFRASFDLADAPVGASVTVTANWHQFTLARTTGRVVAVDPSIDLTYEGDRLTLAPAAGQTVTGTTSLPAGEPLVVRLKSTGQTPLVMSAETTVTSDGSFTATFDLSEVDPGTTFSIMVSYAGEQRAAGKGVVKD